MIEILWLIQLILSAVMMGVIWIIQVLHYPGFRYVAKGSVADFHTFHTTRITPVVAPLMVAELLSGGWLLHAQGGS